MHKDREAKNGREVPDTSKLLSVSEAKNRRQGEG